MDTLDHANAENHLIAVAPACTRIVGRKRLAGIISITRLEMSLSGSEDKTDLLRWACVKLAEAYPRIWATKWGWLLLPVRMSMIQLTTILIDYWLEEEAMKKKPLTLIIRERNERRQKK